MKTFLLICITLACVAVNVAQATEQAAPADPKIYGWRFPLPGIYKPPVVVTPTCTNDKVGCPTGETCAAGPPPKCSTAATTTACASSVTVCAATCAATACKVCDVPC